jgi:hypothetical protein
LVLLIDRENDGMGEWINIGADDVAQLVNKLRGGGEFELFHAVRLKSLRTPNALDGTRADIADLRHHGGGPVSRLCCFGYVRSQGPDARGARLIVKEAS